MISNTLPTKRVTWLLAGQLADDQPMRHVRVDSSRFTVGRKPDASLSIPSPTVSREHAELTVVDRGMLLRDLGSTNGTFVNGVRIQQPCTVQPWRFAAIWSDRFSRCSTDVRKAVRKPFKTIPAIGLLALIQFDQLMNQRAVTPHFQPIVEMAIAGCGGLKCLARSRFFGLKDPHSMFAAAKVLIWKPS